MWWSQYYYYIKLYYIIIIFLDTRYLGSRGILEKIEKKQKIVGVTITPSSPPEQTNHAAERCYIAARVRKRTKMQSPARGQHVCWFSSLEVRENQKQIH